MKKDVTIVTIDLKKDIEIGDVVINYDTAKIFIADITTTLRCQKEHLHLKPQQVLVLSDEINYTVQNYSGKVILAAYPALESIPTISLDFLKEWVKDVEREVEIGYFKNSDTGNNVTEWEELKLTPNNEVILSFKEGFNKVNSNPLKLCIGCIDEYKPLGEGNCPNCDEDCSQYTLDITKQQEEKDIKEAIHQIVINHDGASYIPDVELAMKVISWYKEYLKTKQ